MPSCGLVSGYAVTRAAELPARKIPFMRKIAALPGFYRLDAARIVRIEHDACPIGSIYERKALAVSLQMAQFIDKVDFVQSEVIGNGGDILICEAHVTLPSAACATTLAAVHDAALCLLVQISHGFRVDAVI